MYTFDYIARNFSLSLSPFSRGHRYATFALFWLTKNLFKTSTHSLKSSYKSVNGKVNTAKKASKRLIFCIFSSRSSSRFSVDVVEFTASSGKFRGGVALYPKVSEVRFDARLAKFVLLFVVVVVSAISPVARTIEFK